VLSPIPSEWVEIIDNKAAFLRSRWRMCVGLISLRRTQANSMRPNIEKPGQAFELYTDCGAIRQANPSTTLCEEDSV